MNNLKVPSGQNMQFLTATPPGMERVGEGQTRASESDGGVSLDASCSDSKETVKNYRLFGVSFHSLQ